MKTYFTFGQAHCHEVQGQVFDKDCVAVIEAEDENAARDIMFKVFGPTWSFSYPEDQWGKAMLQHFPRGYITVENPDA